MEIPVQNKINKTTCTKQDMTAMQSSALSILICNLSQALLHKSSKILVYANNKSNINHKLTHDNQMIIVLLRCLVTNQNYFSAHTH